MKKWLALVFVIIGAFFINQRACFGCSIVSYTPVHCGDFKFVLYNSPSGRDYVSSLGELLEDCDIEGLLQMAESRFSGTYHYPFSEELLTTLRGIDDNPCDCYYDVYEIEGDWLYVKNKLKSSCNARSKWWANSPCSTAFYVLPFKQAVNCLGSDGDVSPWRTLSPYAFTSISTVFGAIALLTLRRRRQKKSFSYINDWQDPSHLKNNDS